MPIPVRDYFVPVLLLISCGAPYSLNNKRRKLMVGPAHCRPCLQGGTGLGDWGNRIQVPGEWLHHAPAVLVRV